MDREREARRRGIGRSLALGAGLAALNAVWVTMVEVRYYMLDGSSLPLFITPLFLLLVLVALNAVIRRFAPRTSFQQEELLIAYIMAVISNTFAGHDMLQNFFGQVTHAYYFAEQGNWQDTILPRLAKVLFVSDKDALTAWYRGNIPFAQSLTFLPHWVLPLALWGAFFLCLVLLFLCISILFRKAWTENERLAFPIIQLPIAMTEPAGTLFRNPLMWAGFAVAFLVGAMNGIHELYPSVPNIPWIKTYNIGQFFTEQPWEAIRTYGMEISFYPFAIGLAYFIPLDLAFSCWFSYLLARAYFVFGRAFGLDGPSAAQGWPFLKEISSGVWLGVAAAILWANGKYLARAFDAAFDRSTRTGYTAGSEEILDANRYRWAFVGTGLCFIALLAFCYILLGVSPVVAASFFLILLALSLAITRVRAEFGTPHEIVFVKPADMLVTLFGTTALGTQNLVGMQSMYWFNRGYRCHPMPNFLEAFKMGEGKDRRLMGFAPMMTVFLVAMIVSLIVTYGANYVFTYSAGAAGKAVGYKAWVGWEAFNSLNGWIKQGQPAGSTNLWYFVGGLAIAGMLASLRTAFLWWPLHPAGFALGTSYAMNYFWMCLLVSWAVKFLLVRYGGMKAHRKAIPFFLGLILGDYTVGALWSLLGLLLGQATYKIFL
jgi:hypothetical protein